MDRVAVIVYRRLKAVEEAVAFLRAIIKPKTGELKTRSSFHDQMVDAFSINEIRQICFDLKINFDELPGDTLTDRCRELYLYTERRGDVHRLIEICQRERPSANWTPT